MEISDIQVNDRNSQSDSGSDTESGRINKAHNVTNECLDYIKQISTSLSHLSKFQKEFTNAFQDKKVVTELTKVFCDIEALRSLYRLIEKIISTQKMNESVFLPDLFLDSTVRQSFLIYRTFLDQFATNAKWLGSFVKDNPVYVEICERIKNSTKSTNPVGVESCLYTVFNSLFAFALLLNRYSECFDVGHNSRIKGEEVQSLLCELLNDINVNQKQIFLAQKELNLLTGKSKEPKINSKFILKEAVFIRNKKLERVTRQLVLFSDCLFITYPPAAITGTSRIRNEISLKDMVVSNITGDSKFTKTLKWGISLNNPEGDYEIFFQNEDAMMLWIRSLQSAVQTYQEVDLIQSSRLGEISPRWQKDTAVGYCNGLNCVQRFTSTVRRHHCRADGLIYCDQCCSNKVKLNFIKSSESKVCQLCYRILFKDLEDPLSLSQARKQLEHVFDLKMKSGIKVGWLEERVYNCEKGLFNPPIKYFCELDSKDPYLNLFEKHEDKIKHHGIILLGMMIQLQNDSKYYRVLKPHEFIIEHQDKEEVYLFKCPSAECCNEWVTVLRESIINYFREK